MSMMNIIDIISTTMINNMDIILTNTMITMDFISTSMMNTKDIISMIITTSMMIMGMDMTSNMIIWISMKVDTMTTDTEDMDMKSLMITKNMIWTTVTSMSMDMITSTESTITMEDMGI